MKASNTLFILSDEHSRETSGCYGHPIVQTPNIDRLAAEGTLFENAYTNCPICIPARASLQTGRYVHQTRNWCNGNPYTGDIDGWAHHLKSARHKVVSIGKLHFRSTDDDNGFTEEIIPLHVVDGIGDLLGCLRKDPPERDCLHLMAENIGSGDSSYQEYDRRIAEAACNWLKEKSKEAPEKPWTLFVSFVCPHFPLIAPEAFFRLYDPGKISLPKAYQQADAIHHPALEQMHSYMNYDQYFDEEKTRIAIASYYGLVSFIDHLIGNVLDALEASGFAQNTRIVYSSDHGDNLGARGFWGKSTFFEESVGIPLILSGPDIDKGKRVKTPVSLVDLAPTLIDFNGENLSESEKSELPGSNLTRIAAGDSPDRAVLSEYHAIGSTTGTFMIRYLNWKYIHYVGYPCQLFDLESDPQELNDLGLNPEFKDIVDLCHTKLLEICNPEAVNSQAFEDQANRIAEQGGPETILKRESIPFTPAPV